jgi:hypothetical protein
VIETFSILATKSSTEPLAPQTKQLKTLRPRWIEHEASCPHERDRAPCVAFLDL